jgi:hypothetical protein
MKTPDPSPDPLFKSLAEEVSDLPLRAAAEARRAGAQRRLNRQRTAVVAVAFLIGMVGWSALPAFRKPGSGSTGVGPVVESHVVKPEAVPALPTKLNPEQAAFVKAVGDMPLLLVRDSSGEVTRIHVIER